MLKTTSKKNYIVNLMSTCTTSTNFDFDHPFILFEKWLQQAKEAQGEAWPNAISLATSTPDGMPSCRTVLMQRSEIGRIAWYTNYASRKGEELEANPRAAALFYWNKLQRQVRMEGDVVRGTKEESDAYFASRPRDSRIASIASAQSKVLIGGTEQLNREVEETKKKFQTEKKSEDDDDAGKVEVELMDVPRPDHMGLYWLIPKKIEFWEEGASRVHTRNVYELLDFSKETNLPESMRTKTWKHCMLYP